MDRRDRDKIHWPLVVALGIAASCVLFAALAGIAYLITKLTEYL